MTESTQSIADRLNGGSQAVADRLNQSGAESTEAIATRLNGGVAPVSPAAPVEEESTFDRLTALAGRNLDRLGGNVVRNASEIGRGISNVFSGEGSLGPEPGVEELTDPFATDESTGFGRIQSAFKEGSDEGFRSGLEVLENRPTQATNGFERGLDAANRTARLAFTPVTGPLGGVAGALKQGAEELQNSGAPGLVKQLGGGVLDVAQLPLELPRMLGDVAKQFGASDILAESVGLAGMLAGGEVIGSRGRGRRQAARTLAEQPGLSKVAGDFGAADAQAAGLKRSVQFLEGELGKLKPKGGDTAKGAARRERLRIRNERQNAILEANEAAARREFTEPTDPVPISIPPALSADLYGETRPLFGRPRRGGRSMRRGRRSQSGEIISPAEALAVVGGAIKRSGQLLVGSGDWAPSVNAILAERLVNPLVGGMTKGVQRLYRISPEWMRDTFDGVRDATRDPARAVGGGERAFAITEQVRGRTGYGREMGVEINAKVRKAMDDHNLSPEDRTAVHRYFSSADPKFPVTAEPFRALLESARDRIRETADRRVELGNMRESTVAQYEQGYLPRMYAIEVEALKPGGRGKAIGMIEEMMRQDGYTSHLPGADFSLVEQVAKPFLDPFVGSGNRGNITFKRGRSEPRFITQDGRKVRVKPKLPDITVVSVKFPGNEAGQIARGEFMKAVREAGIKTKKARATDPIAAEIRAELGEMTDPARAFEQAIAAGERARSQAEMMETIFGPEGVDPMGRLGLDGAPSPEIASLYTQINDPLVGGRHRGKYIRKDMLKYIEETNAVQSHMGRAALLENVIGWQAAGAKAKGVGQGAISGIKTNFVVLSPAAIVRQFFGNLGFLHMAGLSPLNVKSWSVIKQAFDSVRDPTHPLHIQGRQDGIFRGGVEAPAWAVEGLMDARPKTARGRGQRLGQILVNPVTGFRVGRAAIRKAGEVFSFADSVSRQAVYIDSLNKGASRLEAIERTGRTMPNNQRTGTFQRGLANSIVGNVFGIFNAETLRIYKNNIQDNPLQVATWITNYLIASEIAESLVGSSEAEEDAVKATLGSGFVPVGRAENGNLILVDTRFSRISGDFASRPRDPGESALEYGVTLLAKAGGFDESLLGNAYSSFFQGVDRNGNKISKPSASASQKGLERTLHLWGQLSPKILQEGIRVGQSFAGTPRQDIGGREPKRGAEAEDPFLTFMSRLGGLRLVEFDPQKMSIKNAKGKRFLLTGAEGARRKDLLKDFQAQRELINKVIQEQGRK